MIRSSVLVIAQEAAIELNVSRPITLFDPYNEGDTSNQKLRRALVRAGRFLASTFEWSIIRTRHRFDTVAAEAQPQALPDDMMRPCLDGLKPVSRGGWLMEGPLSTDEWAHQTTAYGASGYGWHIEEGVLKIAPVPPAGVELQLTYLRDHVCEAGVTPQPVAVQGDVCTPAPPLPIEAPGLRKRLPTRDTDVMLWDDELMIIGLVMNYRKMDRLDYQAEAADFERLMADRIKRDGGARVLHMGRSIDRLARGRVAPTVLVVD